jgi:hypothetical protein
MSKRLITILGPRLTNFPGKAGEKIDFSRIIPGGELQASKAALHEGEETRESLFMFPSYLTSVEPHRQRDALLMAADVVMHRNSPAELFSGPPPAQSPIVFSSAAFSPVVRFSTLRHPILLRFLLSAPALPILESGVSDGVAA